MICDILKRFCWLAKVKHMDLSIDWGVIAGQKEGNDVRA